MFHFKVETGSKTSNAHNTWYKTLVSVSIVTLLTRSNTNSPTVAEHINFTQVIPKKSKSETMVFEKKQVYLFLSR